MKKTLLYLAILLSSIANSQTSCATAINITGNGTVTTPSYSASTFSAGCIATRTNIRALWYRFTPLSNGEITISSDLPANDGVSYTDDTRVSVFRGTCAGLTCVDANDDIDATNYLSVVTVPVMAGTTYYIQWDNYWGVGTAAADLPLQFDFTFSTPSCIRTEKYGVYLPDSYTTTSAALYWNQALGSPANYDTDWSVDLAAAPGTGTIVTSPAGALSYSTSTITSLPATSNFRYYLRSNCGGSQSAWQGPYFGYLAKNLPYTNTFDVSANNYTDGFIGFTLINTTGTTTPPNYADGGAGRSMYTFNSTTQVSNVRAYSRAINLQAGEQVTINFKTRLYAPTTASPMSLNLTVGNSQTVAGQATVIQNFTLTDTAAYTQHTATWTAPTAGVYYFGFHNNSAIGATQTFAFLDTINITSVLSTKEFVNSNFLIYPNPVRNVLNIKNEDQLDIKSISFVDINGRTVKNITTNSNVNEVYEINISDLSSGIYLMKLKSDSGIVTKKIVKE